MRGAATATILLLTALLVACAGDTEDAVEYDLRTFRYHQFCPVELETGDYIVSIDEVRTIIDPKTCREHAPLNPAICEEFSQESEESSAGLSNYYVVYFPEGKVRYSGIHAIFDLPDGILVKAIELKSASFPAERPARQSKPTLPDLSALSHAPLSYAAPFELVFSSSCDWLSEHAPPCLHLEDDPVHFWISLLGECSRSYPMICTWWIDEDSAEGAVVFIPHGVVWRDGIRISYELSEGHPVLVTRIQDVSEPE